MWSDLLGHPVAMAIRGARWGLRVSWLSDWHRALLRHGLERVRARHSGGRRPQCPPTQKQRWVALLEAGPLVVGGETAWWTAVLSRGLLGRACGVLSNCQAGCPLRPNWGGSFHKARVVSAHRDTAQRLAGLEQQGPTLVRAAPRRPGLRLCAAEASVAPGGSWRDPWARRGRPPAGPPSGTRTGSQVCGAMAYVSGRLCSQGRAGRLHSARDPKGVQRLLEPTTAPLFLLHAGAR